MTTSGSISYQLANMQKPVQAFGTVATTVGTSLLTVSGYQAYTKRRMDGWETANLLIIVALLLLAILLWATFPARPLRPEQANQGDYVKYQRWAEKHGRQAALQEARATFDSAMDRRKELEERKQQGSATVQQLEELRTIKTQAGEEQLYEMFEVVRAERWRWPVVGLLAVITAVEVLLGLNLFRLLSG